MQELYATPTREEMAQLRETQHLFRSNLFRLQVSFLSRLGLRFAAGRRSLTHGAFPVMVHRWRKCFPRFA